MPEVKVTPQKIAELLTTRFLEEGSFASAGGPMSLQIRPSTSLELPHTNFVGFGGLSVQSVGYVVEPKNTDTAQVHVYVSRGSKSMIGNLPKELLGITCSVHNIGKLHIKPRQASASTHSGNLYLNDERIACGSSCAPSGKHYSGTFGAILRGEDGTLFALSNNHVFGDCNHTPIGQPILSPSSSDGRPNIRAPGEICRHSRIGELRSGAPALVNPCKDDLAIAMITFPNSVSSWQGDGTDGYDTPSTLHPPRTDLIVKKFGRTTGFTRGILESKQYRIHIPYDSDNFRSLVWFEGVWSIKSLDIEPFALPGDSGSLVVTDDGDSVVGVVFAVSSNGSRTFIVPAERISETFGNLEFVNGHNV